MRFRARAGHGRCFAAALALATSCAGPAEWRYQKAIEETPAPAAHAVHETRLASLMRAIDDLRAERLPTAFEIEQGEHRRALEISRVARAMAESAARIGAAEPDGLDAQKQRAFRELASELERLASDLADDAPELSPDQRRARLTEIDATCAECHLGFRIPGFEESAD